MDTTVYSTDSLVHAKKVYCNMGCSVFQKHGNKCRKEGWICKYVKNEAYEHFSNTPVIKGGK